MKSLECHKNKGKYTKLPENYCFLVYFVTDMIHKKICEKMAGSDAAMCIRTGISRPFVSIGNNAEHTAQTAHIIPYIHSENLTLHGISTWNRHPKHEITQQRCQFIQDNQPR